jgi:D-aminoacyl-tRNA deacylase
MNYSLAQIQGELLLVPQFTLAADTHKGLRPGFSGAAPPVQGRRLFDALLRAAQTQHGRVASGEFGAHMQVSLTNDGPVTLWLES